MSDNDLTASDDKPLSEPVFLILASLAGGASHGYAVIKDVEQFSDGRVRLSTGTLYGALRRMLESGWIEVFEQEDRSRDKQAYRLTREGRRRVEAELRRMKHLTRVATTRLRTRST